MADLFDFGSNILRGLRNRNIFGVPEGGMIGNDLPSQGGITGRMPRPTGSVVEDDDYDPATRMREIYQPESRALDEYYKMLEDMPTRNKPGLMRKIAAGIAAFGSRPSENVEQVLYGPYRRDLADWQTRIKPVEAAANIERQNNANLRMIANQIVSQEQADRRIERQISRDRVLREQGEARLGQGEERIRQGDERIRQADARMQIAREVAKGGQFQVDDSGNAFIVRRDGTTIPVDASYLTAEEKSELRVREVGAGAAARAANARDRIIERVIEDPNNPGKYIRVAVNLDTQEVTPLTVAPTRQPERPPAAPPRTELEEGRDIRNKAQEVAASNPKWSKWITITPQGVVKLAEPSMFSEPGGVPSTRPSKAEHAEMYRAIYGTEPPASRSQPPARGRGAGPGGGQPANRRPANAPPAGRVRVIGPNNERGTVTEEEARSLPPGWRRAQ